MYTYHTLWAAKTIIWILCIILVNYNIDVKQDLLVWSLWILIWIFLIFWGMSYFLFYLIYTIISHKKLTIIANQSYKMSFLIWIWWVINIAMIFWEIWNVYIWLTITVFFLWIIALMFRTLNYKYDNITEFIPENIDKNI